jgi:hypothetical protein
MILIAIKAHMMTVKKATLHNLCLLFNKDAEQLRCMLQHWIRKGKIRQCMKKPACGSKCFSCPSLTTEIYEWVDSVHA